MSVIGDNIRALRELHGLTQQELADLTGVSRETVNKWEMGAIGNVRTSHVEALRERFSLSIDDLRSESCGLAAKANRSSGPDEKAHPYVPLASSPTVEDVEVTATLLANHPHAFAWTVPDDSMARTLPRGCHAIIDPDAVPTAGSVILAKIPDLAAPILRQLSAGSTKAMLSADCDEDRILDLEDLDIRGVVVWFQAASEL